MRHAKRYVYVRADILSPATAAHDARRDLDAVEADPRVVEIIPHGLPSHISKLDSLHHLLVHFSRFFPQSTSKAAA